MGVITIDGRHIRRQRFAEWVDFLHPPEEGVKFALYALPAVGLKSAGGCPGNIDSRLIGRIL